MNEARSSLIASVIQKRQPLAERIERVISHVKALNSSLASLQTTRDQLLGRTHDAKTAGNLRYLDFLKLQKDVSDHLNALTRLKERFSRKTLNIGVVGRARQGKSRLLQSLTGLTRQEIPDGNRLHCTGVRSTIYHQPNVKTHGEVSFHTEQSFLGQVITPYYVKLGLGNPPKSISEFENTFPDVDSSSSTLGQAESRAMFEHLKKYHLHLGSYKELLSKPDLEIEQSQIREYVAQDNLEGKSIYKNYLAVREVRIICQFPNEDIGQIALVDMPGLGDTGTGDEQRLIRTLGQDVDIILFVRMPKVSGDHWADVDVALYDTACRAIPELPLDLWSFMILNHYIDANTNNLDNCHDLLGTIAEHHIRVSQCFITNCVDKNNTDKMLEEVLNYVAQKIEYLDSYYAKSCQKRLMEWHENVEDELNKARNALETYANQHGLFTLKFNELWKELSNQLEELVKTARNEFNQPDKDFEAQVEKVIHSSLEDTGVPSESDITSIEKERNTVGSYAKAYSNYLDCIRTRLSKEFLHLDGRMQESLDKKKGEVAQILADKIGFNRLTNSQKQRFLEDLNSLIPDEFKNLKMGFNNLIEFNVTYAAIVQRSVRELFDELHSDRNPLLISQTPALPQLHSLVKKVIPYNYSDDDFDKLTADQFVSDLQSWWNSYPNNQAKKEDLSTKQLSKSDLTLLNHVVSSPQSPAKILQITLSELHAKAVEGCKQRLEKLILESSRIRYVMIAEFVDRVLWSEGARDNWRDFLQNDSIASELWDDFRDINNRKEEREKWISLVKAASDINKILNFNFLD